MRDGAIVAKYRRNFFTDTQASGVKLLAAAIATNGHIASAMRRVPSYPDILIGSRGLRFVDIARLILFLQGDVDMRPSDHIPASLILHEPIPAVKGTQAEQLAILWPRFCRRVKQWATAHPDIVLPPSYTQVRTAVAPTDTTPNAPHPLDARIAAFVDRIALNYTSHKKLVPVWQASDHWRTLGADATDETIERQYVHWLMIRMRNWDPISNNVVPKHDHVLIHETVAWLPAETFPMLLQRSKEDRLDTLMGYTLLRALEVAGIDHDHDDLVHNHLILSDARLVKQGPHAPDNKKRIQDRRTDLSDLLSTNASPILSNPTASRNAAAANKLLKAIKKLRV